MSVIVPFECCCPCLPLVSRRYELCDWPHYCKIFLYFVHEDVMGHAMCEGDREKEDEQWLGKKKK